MSDKKKRTRYGRIVTIGHSKYDLYKAVYAIALPAIAGALVLGVYLWDKADRAERQARGIFGNAQKPATMNVANVAKPVRNLTFG